MVQLDSIDRAILVELQRDSRQTYAEIGTRVGLSAATVHNRVKNLEKRQIIQGYGARVDPKAIGLEVVAFISIRLDGGFNCRDIAPHLVSHPEVEECHAVAGDIDTLLKVRVPNPDALEQLIFEIKQIPGVRRTSSLVTLSTQFEHRALVPVELKLEGDTPA
jgi:Lrp/AsnC family transcriptional regulator, leucine-responsive regulatory protein